MPAPTMRISPGGVVIMTDWINSYPYEYQKECMAAAVTWYWGWLDKKSLQVCFHCHPLVSQQSPLSSTDCEPSVLLSVDSSPSCDYNFGEERTVVGVAEKSEASQANYVAEFLWRSQC